MSARHALLGLLRERPAYPYELADRLSRRLGPSWAINSGQVYQTIKRLEAEGLVKEVRGGEVNEDRGFRVITPAGEAEYESWASKQLRARRPSRQPLIVKIALGGHERLADHLRELDLLEQACVEQLSEIARRMDEAPVQGVMVRADQVALRLSLASDMYEAEGQLRWVRHARETVQWLASQDAVWIARGAKEREESGTASDAARAQLFGRLAARESPGIPGAARRSARGRGGQGNE